MKRLWGALFLIAALTSACSGECQLTDLSSCDPGLVCAPVANSASNECAPPVEVRGQVIDATTHAGIGGVIVQALDQSGVPAAQLTPTGRDGAFTLRLELVRTDGKGTPQNTTISLFAGAQGYEGYPGKLRVPMTIDTSTATQSGSGQPYVLQSDASTLSLQPLPADQRNNPYIAGTIEFGYGQGAALIVAESNGQGFASTIADSFGQYVLNNLPPGTYSLGIYSQNASYANASGINVSVGRPANSVLVAQTSANRATLSGTVSFVSGGGPTSVVLIPRSTFDPNTGRGDVVPSLRAPNPGTAPNLTGPYSLLAVPDGDYYVVPAYENDGLVRQPGTGKDGLGVQEVVVINGAANPATVPDLKVVPAVQIVGPGATALESVGPSPTLSWTAYASAASYSVKVFNTAGATVFQATPDGATTRVTVSSALAPGIYQWRVTALDGSAQPLSMSEDLAGVFRVQ